MPLAAHDLISAPLDAARPPATLQRPPRAHLGQGDIWELVHLQQALLALAVLQLALEDACGRHGGDTHTCRWAPVSATPGRDGVWGAAPHASQRPVQCKATRYTLGKVPPHRRPGRG